MSVTVIGAVKFVPVTVIVAGLPVAGDAEPSWLRFAGEAFVAVGGFALYVNGTDSGTPRLHARPGNVRSMKPAVDVQVRLPPRSDWSGGSVTMMEVFDTFVTLSGAIGTVDDARRKFATAGSAKLLPVITTVVDCVTLPTDGDATPTVGQA
jgi:hypothetical protein